MLAERGRPGTPHGRTADCSTSCRTGCGKPHPGSGPFSSRLRSRSRTASAAAVPTHRGEGTVRWKLECFGATGSFKIRGALNKLLVLRDTGGPRVLGEGVVTASTGNHGRATAHALSLLGGRGVVYLPRTVADSKRRVLAEQYGEVVELRLVGDDAVESEVAAREEAARSGAAVHFPL